MKKPTFSSPPDQTMFASELRSAVENYIRQIKDTKFGNSFTLVKAIALLVTYTGMYVTLMLASPSLFFFYVLWSGLGIMKALIGMQIGHDACHGTFSKNEKLNDAMSKTFDFLAASHVFWKIKHNFNHHSYPNIQGIDTDIDAGPILRMEQTQKRYWFHKFQWVYSFAVYSLLYAFWVYFTDFKKLFTGKIGELDRESIELSTKEKSVLILSKIAHVLLFVITPFYIFGFNQFIVGYAVMMLTCGLTISIIFQLAHVVRKTEHVLLDRDGNIPCNFQVLQIKETANFCPGNKFMTHLLGGLNHQVEHHLFPYIHHRHYPAISKIVREKCEKYKLQYNEYRTFWEALVDHVKQMYLLGKKDYGVTV